MWRYRVGRLEHWSGWLRGNPGSSIHYGRRNRDNHAFQSVCYSSEHANWVRKHVSIQAGCSSGIRVPTSDRDHNRAGRRARQARCAKVGWRSGTLVLLFGIGEYTQRRRGPPWQGATSVLWSAHRSEERRGQGGSRRDRCVREFQARALGGTRLEVLRGRHQEDDAGRDRSDCFTLSAGLRPGPRRGTPPPEPPSALIMLRIPNADWEHGVEVPVIRPDTEV